MFIIIIISLFIVYCCGQNCSLSQSCGQCVAGATAYPGGNCRWCWASQTCVSSTDATSCPSTAIVVYPGGCRCHTSSSSCTACSSAYVSDFQQGQEGCLWCSTSYVETSVGICIASSQVCTGAYNYSIYPRPGNGQCVEYVDNSFLPTFFAIFTASLVLVASVFLVFLMRWRRRAAVVVARSMEQMVAAERDSLDDAAIDHDDEDDDDNLDSVLDGDPLFTHDHPVCMRNRQPVPISSQHVAAASDFDSDNDGDNDDNDDDDDDDDDNLKPLLSSVDSPPVPSAKKKLSVFQTSVKQLDSHRLPHSIPSYFRSLQWMGILFLLVSLVHAVPATVFFFMQPASTVVSNLHGLKWLLTRFSMFNCTEPLPDWLIWTDMAANWTIGLALLVFCCWVLAYRWNTRDRVPRPQENHYTVQITNVSPSLLDPKEIANWCALRWGHVVRCTVPFSPKSSAMKKKGAGTCFVTFEYTASASACVQDMRLMAPLTEQTRGGWRCTLAPVPSNLAWDSLSTSRLRTLGYTVLFYVFFDLFLLVLPAALSVAFASVSDLLPAHSLVHDLVALVFGVLLSFWGKFSASVTRTLVMKAKMYHTLSGRYTLELLALLTLKQGAIYIPFLLQLRSMTGAENSLILFLRNSLVGFARPLFMIIVSELLLSSIFFPFVWPRLRLRFCTSRHAADAEKPLTKFDLVGKFASLQGLIVFVVPLTFAFPLFLPLLVVCVLTRYWVDKAVLLRRSQRPVPLHCDYLMSRIPTFLSVVFTLKLAFGMLATTSIILTPFASTPSPSSSPAAPSSLLISPPSPPPAAASSPSSPVFSSLQSYVRWMPLYSWSMVGASGLSLFVLVCSFVLAGIRAACPTPSTSRYTGHSYFKSARRQADQFRSYTGPDLLELDVIQLGHSGYFKTEHAISFLNNDESDENTHLSTCLEPKTDFKTRLQFHKSRLLLQ